MKNELVLKWKIFMLKVSKQMLDVGLNPKKSGWCQRQVVGIVRRFIVSKQELDGWIG